MRDIGSKIQRRSNNSISGRVGVVQFMSPEMAREEEYGTATDMWSVNGQPRDILY